MIPEGQLRIRLDWDGSVIHAVTIESRRLADIARLTRGKAPDQTALLIPLLFSLCGKAQGSAARLALDAAQGKTAIATAEECQVLAEAFQESAWRLLIDLPQRFGFPANLPALAELRRQCAALQPAAALADGLEASLEQHLLGVPCCEWREFATREEWLSRADTPLAAVFRRLREDEGAWGSSEIRGLPEFDASRIVEAALPALLDDPDFAQRPQWQGQPAETGPLARRGGASNRVVDRLGARLDELVWLADALRRSDTLSSGWLKQAQVGENAGLAWLQTARGLLIHYVRLENGTVVDYRIVAPTEWNFHPQGAYVRGLTGQPAGSVEQARARAELLLLALDPCVDAVVSV
ncbi:MAG: nickel-dependent hydrogenase large subunit [Sulfuricella sp.]|nr:nickel-dependent hydrogenase large subunit [Sulfuricella sp.]